VILQAHISQNHSGVNATLTVIRQQYWIPSGRQRLFTCAVSRAVHLEIVVDLCSLQAFRHFVSRQSLPRLMLSDNASTYFAATEELQILFSLVELAENLSRKGVEWHFIPKRAPWFGGF